MNRKAIINVFPTIIYIALALIGFYLIISIPLLQKIPNVAAFKSVIDYLGVIFIFLSVQILFIWLYYKGSVLYLSFYRRLKTALFSHDRKNVSTTV